MTELATTEILGLCKSMLTLFGEFPLNIILTGSVAVIAFGIFARARSAAA